MAHQNKTAGGQVTQATKPVNGQVFIHKWKDLFERVKMVRDDLNLNASALNLFRVLLTFHEGEYIDRTTSRLVVFASNKAIADRLGISGDSTITRNLKKLVEAGLIRMQQSPNKKRFARRGQGGKILFAYGPDIAPGLSKLAELEDLANKKALLHDEMSALRQSCYDLIATGKHEKSLLDEAKRILRRKPRLDVLQTLHDQLCAKSRCENAQETENLSNRSDQNEQHKEQNKKYIDNPYPQKVYTERRIENVFPTLCNYMEELSPLGHEKALDQIASWTITGSVKTWVTSKSMMGIGLAAIVLGYILERQEKIQNPAGYLSKLCKLYSEGLFDPKSLLSASGNERMQTVEYC